MALEEQGTIVYLPNDVSFDEVVAVSTSNGYTNAVLAM